MVATFGYGKAVFRIQGEPRVSGPALEVRIGLKKQAAGREATPPNHY
jgi:hypothetical protein